MQYSRRDTKITSLSTCLKGQSPEHPQGLALPTSDTIISAPSLSLKSGPSTELIEAKVLCKINLF